MTTFLILALALVLVVGALLGALAFGRSSLRRAAEEARAGAQRLETEARRDAEGLRQRALLEAREAIAAERASAEREFEVRRADLQREEIRIEKAARVVEQTEADTASRADEALRLLESARASEEAAATARADAEQSRSEQTRRLEAIADLTQEEARAEMAARLEQDVRHNMARFVKRAQEEAAEQAERNAREILVQAIHRASTRIVVEATVTPVILPSDEMKGRIIGREGRNIRAIETATGVDVLIDDTPNALLLSSFDPVRREIARIALERLIEDGRVHPARVEEVAAKVREEFEDLTVQAGEAAALEMGLAEIHPRLHRLLGRLKYRAFRGHNLLNHSLETALIAGSMAAELGLNVESARRAGLLHEISQADDSPPPVPSVLASAELAGKFGESEEVVHAIQALHPSVEPRSLEALLVSTANRISESRPGARKDNLNIFIERLRRLEEIACAFEGVQAAYAVRAGKEIRVMVDAGKIGDEGVLFLSRDIAAKIEKELDYPGQIRVSVIREIRAVDFAV